MKGHLIPCGDLTRQQKQAMYALLSAHFDGVSAEVFARDLAEKNWVVLVEDQEGRLHGFSTLLYYRSRQRGRKIGVVCSGDTIVEQGARASGALLATWLNSVLWLGRDLEPGGLYWLLISSGYRTYRFLPVFFQRFYPTCTADESPDLGRLADRLARQRWGDSYDSRSGLVRFAEPQRLKAEVSPLNERLLGDRHIAYFVRRTPGHEAGDELVCLVSLATDNLTAAGKRLLHRSSLSRELAPGVPS